MSERDTGGGAFPIATVDGFSWDGMTLRDWFAGQALVGLLACPESEGTITTMASISFEYADAMLAERSK